MPNQESNSKPGNEEQPSSEGLSSSVLFALLADLRREAKSYMEKGNRGTSNADYYCGKSWAYDDAADRLESALKAKLPNVE